MTQFHKQGFSSRFGAMGDEAESVFEQENEGKYVRYGLNRPPVSMAKMPAKIRYTPDYLQSRQLVEVMGVGNDRILKLKYEKAHALQQWHQDMTLVFFLWDSKIKRSVSMPWTELWDILPEMPSNSFPEGKKYWEINVDLHIWSRYGDA